MFIARNAYLEKAITYVRMHGNFNFSAGGAFHDIPHIIKKYGIVPEEIYNGLNYGEDKHNHAEMDAILKAAVDQIVKNPQKKLTTSWQTAIEGILDAYLGKVPVEFEFKGKKQSTEITTLVNAFDNMGNDINKREQQISFQARHDTLTGFYNRSAMLEVLDKELSELTQYTLSLIHI